MSKILAIVPARRGSKRVLNKNSRLIAGLPMIEHVLKMLSEVKVISDLMVSTDCPKIMEISQDYVTIPSVVRPASLSDDFTGTDEVVLHEYNRLGVSYDFIITIYPTSIFITSNLLQSALSELRQRELYRQLFTVFEAPHPIGRALEINKDLSVSMISPENYYKRTQDLKKYYFDAGQFYIQTPEALEQRYHLFCEMSLPFDISNEIFFDIDTVEDFKKANLIKTALINGKK